MNERNRELFALIPASLLVTAGFAAVFIQRDDVLTNVSLTYGLIFLGLCLAAHVVIRFTLPHADPYLFPLVAVLACFGLVMLYRLDEKFARDQAQWFVVGLIAFAGTIIALREDHRVLERYRYSIALAGIGLLLLPRLGSPVNGAYLSFHMGPIAFQPAELAKIAIVIFLASYLRDTRQVLVVGARRFMGITFPPLKHLGPLLAVWGTAMVLLFVIQDLGSSLMFFGAFLALVYVATNRISFVLIGLGLFAVGARLLYAVRPTIQNRVDAWLHPFGDALQTRVGGSFQIAQSIFSQADGGLFGRGFGQAVIQLGDNSPILPAAHTDFIYAVITDELGLLGAWRRAARLPADHRARLQDGDARDRLVLQAARDGADRRPRAAGLRHRRRRHEAHPADRRDAAVHLLRRLLDRRELHPAGAAAARLRSRAARSPSPLNAPILKLFGLFLVLFAALIGMTSYNSVIHADAYRDNARNARPQIEAQRVHRGVIRARDGDLLARSVLGDNALYSRTLHARRPTSSRRSSATTSCASRAPASSASTTTR